MAQFQFDTSTVAPRDNDYSLLPQGDYLAQVTDSAMAPLKSSNGTGLKLTFTVLQQGYNGRKVFVNLNVQHSNPETEKISQQQLRELCEAVGVSRLQDTVELHNKPVTIRVKIREGNLKDKMRPELGKYDDQNEVTGYKPAAGGAPAAPSFSPRPGPAAPAAAAPAAAGASVPPWQKRAA